MATRAPKKCELCAEDYQPTSNRQKYCGNCMKTPSRAKGAAKVTRLPSAAKRVALRTPSAPPEKVPRAVRQAVAADGPPKTNGMRRVAELRQLRDHLARALEGIDSALEFLEGPV